MSENNANHPPLDAATPKGDRPSPEVIFPTPDRQWAYENISAETTLRAEAVAGKRRLVKEIFEERLIPEEVLRNFPAIYLGAGTDIEYPLALGARHIVMVDPALNAEASDEIARRTQELIDEEPERTGKGFAFSFDFGHGDEKVTIELVPKFYNPFTPSANHPLGLKPIPESERYALPDRIGMILGYASHHNPVLESDIGKLVQGGVVLDPSPYSITFDTSEASERFWDGKPEEAFDDLGEWDEWERQVPSLARQKYNDMGLEVIDVADRGIDTITFVRKM